MTPKYLKHGYKILPIVGTHQPTLQSADLVGGRLQASRTLPANVDELLADGDGTVPRLSAIPIELTTEYRDTFVPERHASLQCNHAVLADLLGRLQQMQVTGLGAIRGPKIKLLDAQRTVLSLDLEDVYVGGEPVEVFARLANTDQQDAYGPLQAVLHRVGPEGWHLTQVFQEYEDGWKAALAGLTPGLYRIEVCPVQNGSGAPPPVHDVFEIAG